jgi:Spy/CpxP family protein refolding chaperone
MKKKLTAAASFAALLVAGLAVLGFTGCGHHRPDPARMEKMVTHQVDDALDDLKATPEQRQQITAVKDRLLARGQALRGDRQAVVKEALSLWEASSFDRVRALALVDARLDAMRTMAHEAVDAAAEVHQALTPAQREQVARRVRRHAGE